MFEHKDIVCSFCFGEGHMKECCSEIIPRYSEIKNILKNINPKWFPELKIILTKEYESTLPSKENLDKNERIFSDISEALSRIYSSGQPERFGSSCSGFFTVNSDIDISLEFIVNDQREELSKNDIRKRLCIIYSKLKIFLPSFDFSIVLNATVPIIKFEFFISKSKVSLKGDISINNSLALENTRMLKLYNDLFLDMKKLANLLKCVAKSCDIGDASKGTLSSYAYVVMLVHFLQKQNLLPNLQELYEGETKPVHIIDGYNAWYQSDIYRIRKLWKPKEPSPSFEYLWLQFFYYYIVEFDIGKEVVSIGQSRPLYKKDKGWQNKYMAIEDPFNIDHNLSSVLSLDRYQYILKCFYHVLKLYSNYDNLSRKESIQTLLIDPVNFKQTITTEIANYQFNKPSHESRCCAMKTCKKTIKRHISQDDTEQFSKKRDTSKLSPDLSEGCCLLL